jgi:hypothetical protein
MTSAHFFALLIGILIGCALMGALQGAGNCLDIEPLDMTAWRPWDPSCGKCLPLGVGPLDKVEAAYRNGNLSGLRIAGTLCWKRFEEAGWEIVSYRVIE